MKKLLSFALAFVLCVVSSSFGVFVFADNEVWDGTAAESFKYGSGTETDPYIISDGAELAYFASLVNSGKGENGFFKLVADIKLNQASGSSWTNGAKVWTPIGPSAETPFTGTLDGNHHTISGIYINSDGNNHALFGVNEGIIKNLRITNSVIEGKKNVGGIASVNYKTIIGCSFDGSIKAFSEAGGIAGVNAKDAVIENCRNKGKIVAYDSTSASEGTIAGGIVGTNDGTINNSYNQGTIEGDRLVGGISGNCSGKITACYNTGGLVCKKSYEMGGITAETSSSIENHLSYCIYSSGTAMMGVNGHQNADNVVVAHNVMGMSLKENYVNFDFDKIWTTESSSGYPELRVLKEIRYSARCGQTPRKQSVRRRNR